MNTSKVKLTTTNGTNNLWSWSPFYDLGPFDLGSVWDIKTRDNSGGNISFPLLSSYSSIESTLNEKDGTYFISVIAPGIKKEDFNLSVENGVLSLTFKDRRNKEQKLFWNQLGTISEDSIEAKYEAGILYIEVKKVQTLKTIQIK